MSLQGLGLRDFRCIETADLELHGRCNVISGENASGKTSLLEAIFFLGRGRSFRTARNETLIRKGRHELMLTGRVHGAGRSQAVGVRFGREGIEARAGGERIASLAELAGVMPVQAIDPEVHRLVEEGPQERRRYLDWGVFHVEPNFVDHWRRYQRALRQRNAALRAGQPASVVRAWNPELVEARRRIRDRRRRQGGLQR
jgi:DNA replication and repair protein RecF